MPRRHSAPAHVKAQNGHPLVMAHRGASRLHPENTWPAIDAALELGAHGVEIDVRRSADQVPLLSHDPDLGRTQGERVVIAKQPAATLPLPTLESVVRRLAEKWPDVLLDIELKIHKEPLGTLPPDRLGEILDDAGWRGKTVVTSFDTPTVRRYVREGWTAGLLEGERHLHEETAASLLAQYECDILAVRDPGHYRRLRDAVQNLGAALWVWTLNRPGRLKVARRFQVDAVVTDVPDRALEVLHPQEAAQKPGSRHSS